MYSSRFPRRLALCLFFVLSLPLLAQRLDTPPSKIPGIEIIGPDSPDFNALLNGLVPEPADRATLASALPFSLIVRNTGSRPIHNITVRFEYMSGMTQATVAGTVGQRYAKGQFTQGTLELFTPSGALKMYRTNSGLHYDRAPNMSKEFSASSVLRGSVDSIVYEDNEFVGEDRSGLFETYIAENAQRQALADDFGALLTLNDSDLADRLRQISAADEPPPPAGRVLAPPRRSAAGLALTSFQAGGREALKQMIAQMTIGRMPNVWKQ